MGVAGWWPTQQFPPFSEDAVSPTQQSPKWHKSRLRNSQYGFQVTIHVCGNIRNYKTRHCRAECCVTALCSTSYFEYLLHNKRVLFISSYNLSSFGSIGNVCRSVFYNGLLITLIHFTNSFHNKSTHELIYITAMSNGRHGVSNFRSIECLFDSLFKLTPKKHERSALLSLCPLVTDGFLPRNSNVEFVSLWWRHNEISNPFYKNMFNLQRHIHLYDYTFSWLDRVEF